MLEVSQYPTSKYRTDPDIHLTRGLITRTYREIKKLNSQKLNDAMKKWVMN
jgi:hypothetical protein